MLIYDNLDQINWNEWKPKSTATVIYIIKDNNVVLIEKQRGVGSGKVNAPGGHVENNESPLDCAIRETQEEIGVTPLSIILRAKLHFQMVKCNMSFMVYVYIANDYKGRLTITDEAIPALFPLNDLPYDEMLPSDPVWLPLILKGHTFDGYFVHDVEHNKLLDYRIKFW